MNHQIVCPECGHILGDTAQSLHGVSINCKYCRKAQKVNLTITNWAEYLPEELK